MGCWGGVSDSCGTRGGVEGVVAVAVEVGGGSGSGCCTDIGEEDVGNWRGLRQRRSKVNRRNHISCFLSILVNLTGITLHVFSAGLMPDSSWPSISSAMRISLFFAINF